MAGRFPEFGAHHVWGVNERVPALQILVAHPIFNQFANNAALRVEENQARAGEVLDAEQVQLLTQLAMIPLLGFFELVEILFQVLFVEECRAIDALEALVVLIALPIGSRDG